MAESSAYMVGTKTVIANSDGDYEIRSGGSRNLRNNNPGNIEYGPKAVSMGAVGSDGRFAIFPDASTGSKAVETLLKTPGYQNAPVVPSQGFNQGSIGAAIYRWAPPNENNSSSYAKFVKDKTGLDVNTPMSSLSANQLKSVREAISYYEGHNAPTVVKSKNEDITKDFNNFKEMARNTAISNKIQIAEKNKINSLFAMSASTSTSDLKSFINNDANFLPNILDDYDNTTYRIKLWILPESELSTFSSLSEEEQQNYKSVDKKVFYDSASTTIYGVDNLVINSTYSANGQTKKILPTTVSFDVIEPNGCSFIDDLKWNMQALGYKDHKSVPVFLEVSFTGYHNIEHPTNPLGSDYVYNGNEIAKIVIPLILTKVKFKLNAGGSRYGIEAARAPIAIATSKDYFNFNKKVEISSDLKDLKSFISKIEEELNKAASENSLSEIVKSGLLKDNKIYHFDYSYLEDNPSINIDIIANSGESSDKSAKYLIQPGTSIEKVLDDMTCALQTNKTLQVTNEDKIIESNDWPWLYMYEPEIVYKGEVSSTKQKAFEITYKIKKYFNTKLVLSNPTDKERQTSEMFKLINKLEAPVQKKYDYIFTSKNSQIINLDINLDMLWWVNTYENVAIRNNDDTGMKKTPALSLTDKLEMTGLNLAYSNNMSNISSLKFDLKQHALEEKFQMSLDMSNPKNQAMVQSDFSSVQDIIDSMDSSKKMTGFDISIIPGTNSWDDTYMNKDVEHNTDIKAMSSFDQLYNTGDMVKLNLTIRGDPYWLCNPHNQRINCDKGFIFNMKTPNRRKSGDFEDMSPEYNMVTTIWGLYNVIKIKHSFKQGKFTQDIESVMNPNFRFPL